MLHPAALLTAEEAREADRTAIACGTPAKVLMDKAGHAVATLIGEIFPPCPVLVVCGTGNNGGDGFIVARLLKERGWPVEAALVGDAKAVKGDAAAARQSWTDAGGDYPAFSPDMLRGKQLVVDAVFGTGLNKNIEGDMLQAVASINNCGAPVVAVDIASGVNATDGAVMGAAVRATHTVTFVRPKLGQLLLPGKAYTGTLHVFDIGIGGESLAPKHLLNLPSLWKSLFPIPGFGSHKYTRGHAVVIGGGIESTGASRLAAVSALRAGAGLVSVACSPEALPVYAASLTAVMTKPVKDKKELRTLLEDERIIAVLTGPGAGISKETRERALQILSLRKACVLDADALSAFKDNPAELFAAMHAPAVLTPHEGEFARLFSIEGNKTHRAREAARQSKAVIVLKGNDSVIASPDGRAAVNAGAPAWLATAGSGDVLAGLITGLLAQGMPAFEAACAGVWLQSRAAAAFGPGLIAEDLPAQIPAALKELYAGEVY